MLTKPLAQYTPSEFHEYAKTLKVALGKPKDPNSVSGVNFRVTPKGTPVLTVRRTPKWITQAEIEKLSQVHGFPVATLYILAKAKCRIVTSEAEALISNLPEEELPW